MAFFKIVACCHGGHIQLVYLSFLHENFFIVAIPVSCSLYGLVKIEGPTEELTLNRRGRRFGIWLNVAQVTVTDAPRAYLLAASRKLEDICSPEEQAALDLGFDALRARIGFASEQPLSGAEFDEFLKLKEHSGSYAVSTDVQLMPPTGDRQRLSTVVSIPAALPCEKYAVRLYCFVHGQLTESATTEISIERVGFPRAISALAFEHPAAHGALAVLAALAAGLTMGVIFNSRMRRRT